MLTKNERITESEDYFKKSINSNINFWNGYDLLFKQYEKQSRLKDFKALLDKAKTIYKNNIKLFYYESLYLFRKKEYKQSLSILTNTKLEKKFIQNQNEKDIADYYHLLSRVYEKLELFNESYNFAIKRNKTILAFKENKNFKKELLEDLEKSKEFVEEYMTKMSYRHSFSISYRIRHNEINRLSKTAILLAKTQGIKFLIIAGKDKIKFVLGLRK